MTQGAALNTHPKRKKEAVLLCGKEMSISGRKRVSKWDLQEEPQLFLGGTQHGTGLRKAKESVHNKESQSGSTDSEWYGVKSNNIDDREFSDDMLAWDGDGSYSTRMSPGLEDWRQRNRSHSPIIGRARSDRYSAEVHTC